MNKLKLREFLDTHETPLYIFDMDALEQRIKYLREQFPPQTSLCYAVKANPFLSKELAGLVDRLELCSSGEVEICRSLGISPKHYVISGLYKEPQLVRDLIVKDLPVCRYTVESIRQLAMLRSVARCAGRRIPLLLRLTGGNQFGLTQNQLEELVSQYARDSWVDICGIQYFSGTQKTSVKRMKRELDMLDSVLKRLSQIPGSRIRELEFGPGLPVNYFENDFIDEEGITAALSEALGAMEFGGRITLELGRSIAAYCGHYFTRVVDLKRMDGQNFAIVDGGMHQLVYYGQSMAMKRPRISLPFVSGAVSGAETWNICGSLCTANDILAKQLHLPGLSLGDILQFDNAGAYCMTEGLSLFLSRELPEIVLHRAGKFITVRKRTQTSALNAPDYDSNLRCQIWKDLLKYSKT